MSATTDRPGAGAGLPELADQCLKAWTADLQAQGQVRAALLRDWQELAGPGLVKTVEDAWPLLGAGRDDWPSLAGLERGDWIATSAWLGLHRLLIERGWGGDPLAFASDWHERVLERFARPARWALRAYGLQRGVERLPEVWPQVYPGAVPQVGLSGSALTLVLSGHPLTEQPIARLLLACQTRLAAQLLTGQLQQLTQQVGQSSWTLRVSPRNSS